jgi:hypothetical protein
MNVAGQARRVCQAAGSPPLERSLPSDTQRHNDGVIRLAVGWCCLARAPTTPPHSTPEASSWPWEASAGVAASGRLALRANASPRPSGVALGPADHGPAPGPRGALRLALIPMHTSLRGRIASVALCRKGSPPLAR